MSLTLLLLVVAVHAGALVAVFYAPQSVPKTVTLPTVQGVLILAPPAETAQAPSAQETPPPVEPPPEPVPPKPQPQPKPPEPKPMPKPVVAPPSETAITQAEPEVEQSAPAAAQQVAVPTATDNDSLGAPVTPPHEDAHHLNNPRPAYPSVSRRLREQGTVMLEVLILPNGSVGDVRIKESSGFKRLDDTAVKAVKQWRYTPARRGNETIEYWYLQPIEFSLQ